MWKPKDAFWEKFDACYMQGDARSMYSKCFACKKPVIAAVGRMCDHYAGCKKRSRSIGHLDAGFQPSQKKMVPLTVSSSVPASNNWSKSVSQNDSEDDFFSGGQKHFDFLKNDEEQKLDYEWGGLSVVQYIWYNTILYNVVHKDSNHTDP